MLRLIFAVLALVLLPLPAHANAYFRIISGPPTLAADGTVIETVLPSAEDDLPQRADIIRPRTYIVAGKDGVDFIAAITEGVLKRLYDRSAATSAINWFPAAPPGSQQFALVFRNPILADGCDVITQSHRDRIPAVAGLRFQHQDAAGVWSAWTDPLGAFNTAVSGNKTYTGRCGLPEGGTMIKAMRVAPPADFAGQLWYREFRVSLYGVSAP